MAEYLSDMIRLDICYNCTNNNGGRLVETEQWARYVGSSAKEIEPLKAWQCKTCNQLIRNFIKLEW